MAKQNLLVELFYSSAWHDVTSRVRTRDSITINHGAGNEQIGVVPSDASLTFDNRDGEMNPENRKSSLFGLIGHNTPIRISVDDDIRFSGQVVSWKPRRALGAVISDRGDAWVNISAQGTIRRLGQGEAPVLSAIARLALSDGQDAFRVAYWPCEDDTSATHFAEGAGGVAANFSGDITLAAYDGFPGSAPIPILGAGATIRGQIPVHADGAFSFRGIFFMPEGGLASTQPFVDIYATGTAQRWQVQYGPSPSGFNLRALNGSGSTIDETGFADDSALTDGQRFLLAVDVMQNGSDADVVVFLRKINSDNMSSEIGLTSDTFTGLTVGHATELIVGADGALTGCAVGHLGIGNSQNYIFGIDTAIYGYAGELAETRFGGLCAEDGITSTVVGDSDDTQALGAQYPDTFINLMEEVARTDAGIIHDTRDELGLTFRTGRSLYNQSAAIALDFGEGQIGDPLEPDIDDLGRTNFVTVARRKGSRATALDLDGPLGSEAIGAYKDQVDINPSTDVVLAQHANYHLVLGTDPDPRYPQVVVDLDANPDLAATVSAIDIGDRIVLQNLPEDMGQTSADLLVSGYTEIIGSHRRIVTFNTRPGAILSHIGMLDGDAEATLQTLGAELDAAISAEQVGFAVATTSGPVFTTSPPTGAQILVGGREVMTVTSISGSSSPQTFTVTRDPDQRVAHADASSVSVYRPLRLTL